MASLEAIAAHPEQYSAEEVGAVRRRSELQLGVRVPNSARPGYTEIVRHPGTPNGPQDWPPFLAKNPDQPRTAWQAWQRGRSRAKGTGPAFGTRTPNAPYVWESYDDATRRAVALGSALVTVCGLQPSRGAAGIQLGNGSGWYTADIACVAFDLVSFPLYTSADDDFSQHIINLGELTVVFTTAANVPQMVRLATKGAVPSLKHVIVHGPPADPQQVAAGKAAGLVFHAYEDLVNAGLSRTLTPVPATDPSRPWSVISTSGTTGKPKGSVLTHANLSWIIAVAGEIFEHPTPAKELFHSYLPTGTAARSSSDAFAKHSHLPNTAHVGDRWFCWVYMAHGVPLSFGTPLDLFSDIQQSKPTLMLFVPRVMNRVVGQIKSMVDAEGSDAKRAFEEAYAEKRRMLIRDGVVSSSTRHDQPGGVLHKFRMMMGGRLYALTVGAAAIDGAMLEFARIVFGIKVMEGFGQTEIMGVATACGLDNPYVPFGGTVGPPVKFIDVKLMDVPALGYHATDKPFPRGEVCVRGPNVFSGYLREPDKTAETIDSDGFVLTGDVGELLPDGSIRIIDRSKNVFKVCFQSRIVRSVSHARSGTYQMMQGEFVAPEKIEAVLLRCPWLAQLYVHGELLKRFLVAVVVPDPERVAAWAKERGKTGGLKELCNDAELRAEVHAAMVETGRVNGLLGFEIPKDIALHPDPFTPEEGLTTPSMKNKRPQLKDRFSAAVKRLYDGIPDSG
ncbi:hypothetical protein DFJ74DRAFT_442670 [Hyaloraphidium curvatum]|nr:hypothetical protein DFJ74DRAFT_442670 [Hyaloraphidium curvatum]